MNSGTPCRLHPRPRGGAADREGNQLILEPAGSDRSATLEVDELGRLKSMSLNPQRGAVPGGARAAEAPRGLRPAPVNRDAVSRILAR
ncbi:hypothetical protein DVA67_025850 [Solirubrobacter sp. CPCC 204708]|nr:hypothetical protein [Solirubrobacter deserti]